MSAFVIDTNVGVVANKRHDASQECVTACTNFLEYIMNGEALVVIDAGGEIWEEYRHHMSLSGRPGPGDVFFKWLFYNQANPTRCEQVWIDRVLDPEDDRVYEQFPDDPDLATFDPSDRKFVAVALASLNRPSITNAVDSDWWNHREALERVGAKVEFLCEDQVFKWRGTNAGDQGRSTRYRSP